MKRQMIFCCVAALMAAGGFAANPSGGRPAPNPVLAERLLDERMDVYGLVHWGLNTFTDREWGYGDESPKMFDPKKFDADRVAAAAKTGGLGGIVLVAKHHDGFCLWPTKTTDHNIAASPFRGGKGDVVKELEQACRKAGLRFGVYISPWDRHDAKYGTADYVTRYHKQIRELLSGGYGEIFEMWFDGANGGDGWYGGAKEKRKIGADYYRFDEIFRFVRELQPKVCIFNERDNADFRWPGNEEGLLEPDCRATVPHHDPANYAPYMAWCADGTHEGVVFHPPEADFPLRRGWFYHPAQDGQSKSGEYLMKSYLRTVGNGGTMNLGLAPNRDGEMTDEDIAALRRFGEIRRAFFAKEAKDGEPFNVVVMREDVSRGERIDAWEFTADGRTVLEGRSIGTKRIRVLETPALGKDCALKVLKCVDGEPVVTFKRYFVDPVLLTKVLRATCAGGETDTAKWMQGFRGLAARPQPMPEGAKPCTELKADVDGKPLPCWNDAEGTPCAAFAFSLRAAVTVTFPEKVTQVTVEPAAKKLRFYQADNWVSVIVNEPGEYVVRVNGGKWGLEFTANDIRSKSMQPDYLKSAVVYQLVLRTFTRDGTFAAATEMLGHVRDCGADVVYLTPFVTMDTDSDRKGWSPRQIASGFDSPKNPYRIADYDKVDPEYGTEADFNAFTARAHELGLRVYMDLVYYHCGPNNVLKTLIPDAFQRTNGVVRTTRYNFPYLNFESKTLRTYLIESMRHWIRLGCDGFRCDVGDEVPIDFWVEARTACRELKPDLVMINEGVKPEWLEKAFDACYAWPWSYSLRHWINPKGHGGWDELKPTLAGRMDAIRAYEAKVPDRSLMLSFLDNHDTANDDGDFRFDRQLPVEAGNALFTLSFLRKGVPLVFNGNEIADNSRSTFFGPVGHPTRAARTVDWARACQPEGRKRLAHLRRLAEIRHTEPSVADGTMEWKTTGEKDEVVAFVRTVGGKGLFVVANLSLRPREVAYDDVAFADGDPLLAKNVKRDGPRLTLAPWGHAVFKVDYAR